MNHPAYRPDIDGLRAIAILSVVAFHAFPSLLHGGFIGVDIFFVISGYLITTIIISNLARGQFSFREFYVRRVKRIFPALVIVLFGCFVVGWMTLFADEFMQLGKHITAGAFFFSNFALLQEAGYFDTAAETKPLLHLWSLGIEEQYYIIWPLLIAAAWRRPRIIPWLIALMLVVSLLANTTFVADHPTTVFYLPFTRFWELLAGSALAYIIYSSRQRNAEITPFFHNPVVANGFAFAGVITLLAAVVMFDRHMTFPGWWAVLPVMATWLLIIAGPQALPNKYFLSNPLMIWFGLISYPLYLWHWPILSFSRNYGIDESNAGYRVALIMLSILLAWLTYKWIEAPIRFTKGHRIGTRQLVVVMAVLGVVGFATYDHRGFTFRAANAHGIKANYDWPAWYRFKSCFIETKEGAAAFKEECDGRSAAGEKRPLVLLWGDSHAASLYPGLKHAAEKYGFDVAQFTANGCPPVLGFTAKEVEPQCPEINRFVLNKIETLKPDMVIVAGYWANYNGQGGWNRLQPEMITASLVTLKRTARQVTLFGQLPVADIAQPHIAARAFEPLKVNRSESHFLFSKLQINQTLQDIARQVGVGFVSPAALLCNAEGCLISTSAEQLEPVAWDYGHLTKSGSEWLMESAISHGGLHFSSRLSRN